MEHFISIILASPFWTFLSVVVIAWMTHTVIASRERKQPIRQKQLEIYLSALAPLSEFYSLSLQKSLDEKKLWTMHCQHIRIMGTLSLVGTADVMQQLDRFSDYVFSQFELKAEVEEKRLRHLFANVTYAMCCDVHGEKFKQQWPMS